MKQKIFRIGESGKKDFKTILYFIIGILLGLLIGWAIGYEAGLKFAINKGLELLNRPDFAQILKKVGEIYGA